MAMAKTRPRPIVGASVTWVTPDGDLQAAEQIRKMVAIYGSTHITVFKVFGDDRVSLSKWGCPMVHMGTEEVRSFSWSLLRPVDVAEKDPYD